MLNNEGSKKSLIEYANCCLFKLLEQATLGWKFTVCCQKSVHEVECVWYEVYGINGHCLLRLLSLTWRWVDSDDRSCLDE